MTDTGRQGGLQRDSSKDQTKEGRGKCLARNGSREGHEAQEARRPGKMEWRVGCLLSGAPRSLGGIVDVMGWRREREVY